MPSVAVRFAVVDASEPDTAPKILGLRHILKMSRVKARPVATEMVELVSDRTNEMLIGHPVRIARHPFTINFPL